MFPLTAVTGANPTESDENVRATNIASVDDMRHPDKPLLSLGPQEPVGIRDDSNLQHYAESLDEDRTACPTISITHNTARVRTHKLNENLDDDFEPRTGLNQPSGGLAVLIANCAAKARL